MRKQAKNTVNTKYQSLNIVASIINFYVNNILIKFKTKIHKIVKNAKQNYYYKILKKLDSKNIF